MISLFCQAVLFSKLIFFQRFFFSSFVIVVGLLKHFDFIYCPVQVMSYTPMLSQVFFIIFQKSVFLEHK